MKHLSVVIFVLAIAIIVLASPGCAPDLTEGSETTEFVSAIEVLESEGAVFETETFIVEGEDKPFVVSVNRDRQDPESNLYWYSREHTPRVSSALCANCWARSEPSTGSMTNRLSSTT